MFEEHVWVNFVDRLRKEEARRRVHVEQQLSDRVDQSVLRWLGQMERMDEEQRVKESWMLMRKEIEREVGRSWDGWME